MAVLFMDGFEVRDGALKWDSVSSYTTAKATPRVGTGTYYAISSSSSLTLSKTIPAATRVTAGIAMRVNTYSDFYPPLTFYSDNGTAQNIIVGLNSSGYLVVYRESYGGTVLGTGTTQLRLNVWFYLEVQATVSSTSGTVEVRVNGAATPEISFTGNTKSSWATNDTIDQVTFSGETDMDDCYILDSTGMTNTTFLGDIRVVALMPNGNGSYSQLLGSDGNSTDNYLLVNEQPYSTSNYVGSSTVGQRDTYLMADLPAATTSVLSVQNNLIAGKSDAGAASLKPVLDIGGSLQYGPTRVLGTSYASYHDVYDTNPATTVNWTIADVNSLEDGMEVA